MKHYLQNKVAIVTGGAGGIGRATALVFAREGARVMVTDRNQEGGKETVDEIMHGGGEAKFHYADITKEEDIQDLIAATNEVYGRLDVAFNNAGIEGHSAPTHLYPVRNWAEVIDTNLTSVFLSMKHQIPEMLKVGGGAILNCSSILGQIGFENSCAYTASKHGVIGLTRVAALEYAKQGIRVNAICPGFIDTPMVQRYISAVPGAKEEIIKLEPVGRLGKPKEIAECAVWLCSPAAGFVTGETMTADGGYLAR